MQARGVSLLRLLRVILVGASRTSLLQLRHEVAGLSIRGQWDLRCGWCSLGPLAIVAIGGVAVRVRRACSVSVCCESILRLL